MIGQSARVTAFPVLCGSVGWYRISRLIAKEQEISIEDPRSGTGPQRYGVPV